MSNEACFYTRNPPRMRVVRDMDGQDAVRAYRESPESVQLQLRMKGRFVSVSLSFEEAQEVIARIQAAIDKP